MPTEMYRCPRCPVPHDMGSTCPVVARALVDLAREISAAGPLQWIALELAGRPNNFADEIENVSAARHAFGLSTTDADEEEIATNLAALAPRTGE